MIKVFLLCFYKIWFKPIVFPGSLAVLKSRGEATSETLQFPYWCAGEDLNLQAFRHHLLKMACLPDFTTRALLL
jgi:hypothetical protein